MIIERCWRRSLGASVLAGRGGMFLLNLVRGNRFGNVIDAGPPMAPMRRCSPRSAHTAASLMTLTWPHWYRSIRPASALTNTRPARALRTTQGAQSNYTNLADEPADHALGRSRGGWTTKIHALIDAHCAPLVVALTPGQAGDNPQLQLLLIRHTNNGARGFRLLADKAYSHDSTRAYLREHRIAHTIPERSTRSCGARPKDHMADVRRVSTRRDTDTATPSNAASTASNTGAPSPPATTNTP